MPKIKYQPPKYCKVKVRKKLYAAVYRNGKTIYLGAYGSPESKIAYTRFVAELKADTAPYLPENKASVTVQALVLSFLDHVKGTITSQSYGHHRSAIRALLQLYGDDTHANNFTPSCLKLFRQELINSKRLCRTMVNNHTRRVVSMFTWGVEEGLVNPHTELALKAVKPLSEGYPGTFDHPEREDVPDDVIRRTVPFMSPTVQVMVKVQRQTGMRPGEVFKMRVGEIDRITDPEFWLYRLPKHKTQKKTKLKKVVPLSKFEQEWIAPYLENKSPEAAVFSPNTAKAEQSKAKRVKPSSKEFFNKDSYRNAVVDAINRANKELPNNEKIPHWTPYQLRHSASSAMEIEEDGIDKAQALLGHTTPNTTARYNHRQLQKLKELARNRKNVFGE
jgi:integrase